VASFITFTLTLTLPLPSKRQCTKLFDWADCVQNL